MIVNIWKRNVNRCHHSQNTADILYREYFDELHGRNEIINGSINDVLSITFLIYSSSNSSSSIKTELDNGCSVIDHLFWLSAVALT